MKSFNDYLVGIAKLLKTRGSFVQNFSIVFGGKSLAVILGIFITPILARIYSPEAYGLYAIYFALVANFSLVISLRLPMAFILATDEQEFKTILKVTMSFVLYLTVLILLMFLLWRVEIFDLFNAKKLNSVWYVIIIGTLLHAITSMLGSWNVREKAFKVSTTVALSEATTIKASNLLIGIKTAGNSFGLIIGDLIGKIVNLIFQFVFFIRNRSAYLIPCFSFKLQRETLSKHWKYPVILLPTSWIAVISNNLVIFYITYQFDISILGEFSMSSSLILIPVNLIANSSQPILMQRMVELNNDDKSIAIPLVKYVSTIIYGAAICCPLIILLSEPLISVFLGDKWQNTPQIIEVLSPTLLFQILFISLAGVLIALEKKERLFRLQVIRLLTLSVLFVTSNLLNLDFYQTIMVYSVGFSLLSFVLILNILKSIDALKSNQLIWPFISFISLCSITFLITR
ncbi:Membrane protein involved in the export of O-antigen and teichoic acid [Ekhidna lutea]|uniref:Membrane protein involved in the export of O-antigen and teichoic acid n=1 Tax=Ekhidna lutea TaxID=447679 RepID=A0A239J7U7_EKHLU|nr:oligosaccharide flippase family protein [Ekhidna lutea]SNT01875.1 Membrane protein involved in the export of O-antigen and teichoic acid [Ekhidna lutea]